MPLVLPQCVYVGEKWGAPIRALLEFDYKTSILLLFSLPFPHQLSHLLSHLPHLLLHSLNFTPLSLAFAFAFTLTSSPPQTHQKWQADQLQ